MKKIGCPKKEKLDIVKSRSWAYLLKRHRMWEVENNPNESDKLKLKNIKILEMNIKSHHLDRKLVKSYNYQIYVIKKTIASWVDTSKAYGFNGNYLQKIYGGDGSAKNHLRKCLPIKKVYKKGPMGLPLWAAFRGEYFHDNLPSAVDDYLADTNFIEFYQYKYDDNFIVEEGVCDKDIAADSIIRLIDTIADCVQFFNAFSNWKRIAKLWKSLHLELEKSLSDAKHALHSYGISITNIYEALFDKYKIQLTGIYKYIIQVEYPSLCDPFSNGETDFDSDWFYKPSAWYALSDYKKNT